MYDEKAVIQRILAAIERKSITKKEALLQSNINTSFLTDWEKGRIKSPGIDKLVRLAECLDVSLEYLVLGIENLPPSLRGDEKRLLRLYNEMDQNGRRLAMIEVFRLVQKRKEDAEWFEMHQDAIENLMIKSFGSDWGKIPSNGGDAGKPILWEDTLDDFERDDSPYAIFKSLPLYLIRPSAGTGAFLDSSDYELIDLPIDRVPIQATFCVSINGDSMSPDYHDDEILFVKQQPTVENGELGIFLYNGDSYFKQYIKDEKRSLLRSFNPDYEPMIIKESDEIRVIGKVIGKYQVGSSSDKVEPSDDVVPEVYAAARDGGGFEKVTDPDQARAMSRIIRQRKKSDKPLP